MIALRDMDALSDPDWDARLDKLVSKSLFHERAWLRFLVRSQAARIRAAQIVDEDGETLGYFCGGEVSKGPFRLFGSPLQGWTTPIMGPVMNRAPETLAPAIAAYCRSLGVHYVEMRNPLLPAAAMMADGWTVDVGETLLVSIASEADMWRRLSPECRNRIRRGEGRGLHVEAVTDRAFVATYYAQLRDVFARQRLVPTYGPERVEALWDELMPAGRLLALRVVHGGETVAAGLFPHDDRMMFFWGGASWTRAYALYPNELLHWHAMLFAARRGIPVYDMSGAGRFKAKFGGAQTTIERWHKSLNAFAGVARPAYARYVRARQHILGRLHRARVTPGQE